MPNVILEIEAPQRGCGTRQQEGYYMVGDFTPDAMSFFPRKLDCSCGFRVVRPSRSTQGFWPGKFWPELNTEPNNLITIQKDQKCWAMTIDTRGYSTPKAYIDEAARLGISRRLNNGLPKGFEIGKDVVFIIHSKVYKYGDKYEPGFIGFFKPKEIQYVVSGRESEQKLRQIAAKKIVLVSVNNSRLPKDESDED